MKIKPTSYIYNFYTKDDGDGSPIIIDIDGFKVQVGINVVILPGFHIKPCKERSGQLTIVGSNSFLGKGEFLEEGSVSPEGTILQGQPLFDEDLGIKVMLAADDFGRTHENNVATIDCLDKGFLHHVSLMVNRNECSEEAKHLIKECNLAERIGLHFNITEGYSLSNLAKDNWYSVNNKNNFGFLINRKRSSFFLFPHEKKQLVDELRIQIETFKSFGLRPHYFDSHGNIHFKWPIAKTIWRILKEEGFKFVRVPRCEKSKHKIYDFLYKRRVTNLYKKHFQTANKFLNASDLLSPAISSHKNQTIEVMVHPYIKNGLSINRRDIGFEALIAYLKSCGIELLNSQDYIMLKNLRSSERIPQ